MSDLDIWQKKHKKYLNEDWIDKPTIFAEFAINYFPNKGKVLDLGCGIGQDSRFFADKGYEVVATDFSDEAIKFAKLKTVNVNKIKYDVHDLKDEFTYENETFDVVYSHLSIQFFDDYTTNKIFSEIKRVLKPDGIVAIMVNTLDDPEVLESKFISDDLYLTPNGLTKRFYTINSLFDFTKDKFKKILLDSNGETYKDKIKTLIRYIGVKV
jgi:SAM-dependent methyltransferase